MNGSAIDLPVEVTQPPPDGRSAPQLASSIPNEWRLSPTRSRQRDLPACQATFLKLTHWITVPSRSITTWAEEPVLPGWRNHSAEDTAAPPAGQRRPGLFR